MPVAPPGGRRAEGPCAPRVQALLSGPFEEHR